MWIIIIVVGIFVLEALLDTIQDITASNPLLIQIAIVGIILFALYFIIPKKRYVRYIGTESSGRTVGKRGASITLSPNYDGTSYSGSIDWGDPGDRVYSVYDVYEFPSGRRKKFYKHSSYEWESENNNSYGVLVYSLFFHSFKHTDNAYEKFIEEKIEERSNVLLCPTTIFRSYNIISILCCLFSMFPPAFLYSIHEDFPGVIFSLLALHYFSFFIPIIIACNIGSSVSLKERSVFLFLHVFTFLIGYYFAKDASLLLTKEMLFLFIGMQIVAFIISLIKKSKKGNRKKR